MDIDPKRLSVVIETLYAATVDPAVRSALSTRMANAFNAGSCLMHTREAGPQGVTIIGATANIQALMPAYVSYKYARDQWAERAALPSARGRAFLGDEIMPERELIKADWYQDLCKPYEAHHIVGSVFNLDPKTEGQIGIHRSLEEAPFEAGDREMLALLLPHLKQVYRLMRIVDASARATNFTFEVLAALAVGVIVVGVGNRVRLINTAAEKLVAGTSAIFIRNCQLSLLNAKLDGRLREAAWRASLAPLGRSLSAGEAIVVPAGEGRNLTLALMPLPLDVNSVGPIEPLVAILISGPSSDAKFSTEAIKALYNLTPAETRLLLALLKGETLSDYAARSGVTMNTAQSQLKAIFAKTDTHRQADLVAKLLGNPILRITK